MFPHARTYLRLEVSLTASLNDNGVVLDFDDLRTIVHDLVLDHLDHTFLNDVLDNPTAERIALHILESARCVRPRNHLRETLGGF